MAVFSKLFSRPSSVEGFLLRQTLTEILPAEKNQHAQLFTQLVAEISVLCALLLTDLFINNTMLFLCPHRMLLNGSLIYSPGPHTEAH